MEQGPACRTEANPRRNHRGKREQGRQFTRGRRYLPGDHRIRSGFRKNEETARLSSLPFPPA
eukprot:2537709-Pyramimonas_sp.AAC.1